MIEIICNGEDDSNKGNMRGNADIRRPKNIKQIGDVSSNRKIYIEDYAFTYINSVAYQTPEDEQAGVLLGEVQKSDEEKCLFIKGVIKARHSGEDGRQDIYFDEKVWNGIYADVEKYFPNLQVVGWFAALPDVTTERMQYLRRVHLDNFAGNMKTMYLINKAEKDENFYLFENGDLKKQKGYVCFYERNYEMQEYMLQKRGVKSVEAPEKDKVMKSIRAIINEKEEQKLQKKNAVFMYGISSFMVVVVLVIGINLKYPKAQLEEKQIGEAMTADDFEITATDVSFMSQEDFSDIYAFEKEMFKEAECIMVTVNIKNMSEEKQRVTLEGFTLTSQAWTTCTAPDKYMAVNEKWNSEQYQSGSIYIESGEERKLILPFLLVKNGFTQKQWEHVKERNYELVLSLYPVKKQIKLKCV